VGVVPILLLAGAVVGGVAIFFPSFVLMLGILPVLEHIERVAWVNAAKGMSPAIIGMLAVTLIRMLPTAVPGLLPGMLALATVVVMLGWRVGPFPLMAMGGILGLVWGLDKPRRRAATLLGAKDVPTCQS
jgi:chromate transporter